MSIKGRLFIGLLASLVMGSVAMAAPAAATPAVPARDADAYPPGDVRRLAPGEAHDLLMDHPILESQVRARWYAFGPSERVVFLRTHPWWRPGIFLLGWDDLTYGEQVEFLCWFPMFVYDFQACWDDWDLDHRWVFIGQHPGVIERIGVRPHRDIWWWRERDRGIEHRWAAAPLERREWIGPREEPREHRGAFAEPRREGRMERGGGHEGLDRHGGGEGGWRRGTPAGGESRGGWHGGGGREWRR